MRKLVAVVAVAAVALFLPASSFAERIGPRLPHDVSHSSGLSDFGTLSLVQVRFAGKPMTAPFTGTIKSFGVQNDYGFYGLQVLRRDADGWRVLRSTGGSCHRNCGDVSRFDANLHIRAGDFIGLKVTGPESYWSVFERQRLRSRSTTFSPALELGSPAQSRGFSERHHLVLYNARLVR